MALLEWEPTLILLQPLALLEWKPTQIHEQELWQPLALLERQPTLSHDAVPAPRPRSTVGSSGSPRLSECA